MERVKKGEKYWIITQIGLDACYVPIIAGEFKELDDDAYNKGNYFHTKEEAEAMAKKLRAVLNGADVIEKIDDLNICDIERENEFESGISVGWQKCYNWLKSKIVK